MKKLYLIIFKLRYILARVKQHEKTVLFITDFDAHNSIDRNISHFHYKKLYITPKNDGMKKQIKAIKKAKYIFVDNYYVGFAAINTDNKVITQIWHADGAIKKFGLADHKNLENEKDVLRYKNVYNSFDHVVVSSDIMVDNFKAAFGYENDDKFLKLGYPKMDMFHANKYLDEVEKVMARYPDSMDKLSILYLPTFRDNDVDNQKQIELLNYLASNLDDKFHIYYHLHPSIKKAEVTQSNVKEILTEDVNYFYKIANLIITDYSSILFEVTKFNTPVISYLYDYDKYIESPGLFLTKDEMPGSICYTEKEVLEAIKSGVVSVDYSEFYKKHNKYVTGQAGRDIVMQILGGNV